MYRLQIDAAIRQQIDDQVLYMLAQGTGEAIVRESLGGLALRMDQLCDHPRMGGIADWPSRICGYEVRRLRFRSHIVFYRVHDALRLIEVLSFRHGHRGPWREHAPP